MTKIKYPVFLSGKPKGEDKFEGSSQIKLAKVVSTTIKENSLEKKVIGLEGEWGAGKSNVIQIIKKELGNKYYTFVFDSWGNQEDLTRKSFLEQLISQLFAHEFINGEEKWKKLENELLSKTSIVNKTKFPKIKSYWILIMLSIFLLTCLSSFYENVIMDNKDIIPKINFGTFWKPVLSIYLLPIILFLIAIGIALVDFFKKRKENEKKEPLKQETKWDTWGKIFYWFSGQEVDSTEVENVLEEEPSVKRFREYFSKIESDIKSNKKKLVIVFDNIDRLEEDKVKSLWSSIHTFFADDTENVDSWIIVPYDKKRLNIHFGGGGFVEKTFAINFRVTPPMVTQWESFLKDKFEEAFGTELIDDIEKEYIFKLFDILSLDATIKPRKIINYINDLVALYKHWEGEIEKGALKMRYIALFVLTKNKIIDKPSQTIINKSYLEGVELLFEEDESVDSCMSMIVFGVEADLADEVLLDRQLRIGLRTGDGDLIKSLSSHRAFESYFRRIHENMPLNERLKGLVDIYKVISSVFSDTIMVGFWRSFANEIVKLDSQFKAFNKNHKAILTNTSIHLKEQTLIKLFSVLRQEFSNHKAQEIYYSQIKEVEDFIESKEINLNLEKLLKNVEFNSKAYLNFIKKAKRAFPKYKITCKENELIDSFYKENIIKIETVYRYKEELNIIKKIFDLSPIIQSIETNIKTIKYTEKEMLDKHLLILKTLSPKPIKLELSNNFYVQLSSAVLKSSSVYEDAFCIAISNFDTARRQSGNFQNSMASLTDEQVQSIAKKIEWYFDYNDLLKLLVTDANARQYPKLKDIVFYITNKSPTASRLDINWALSNFDKIGKDVFDSIDERIILFAKKLNTWRKGYEKNVEQISTEFFKFLQFKEIELMKTITTDSLEYFNSLSKEEVLELLKKDNKNFKIFKSLLDNDLISSFSSRFYSAYDDYMKEIGKGNVAIPDSNFWDKLIVELDGRKLVSTFTSLRDILINGGEVDENLLYFLRDGLIRYGNLSKKPESSTLKLIIPMIESDKIFGLFLENYNILLPIINSSEEHKETVLIELGLRYNSDEYANDENMLKVATLLGLTSNKNN